MKKSKWILPIIASVGTIAPTTVALVSMTSCSKYELSANEISHAAANALAGVELSTNITLDVPKVLKQVDILVENLGGETIKTESIEPKSGYSIGTKTTITLNIPEKQDPYTKTFELHYNNEKNKIKATEIKSYYKGICDYGNASYNFKMTVENESKEGKTEVETKFKLYCFDQEDDYIEVKTEKETKATKEEHKYEYTTKKGTEEEEYSIELTQKQGKNLRVEVEKEVETNNKVELYFERLTATESEKTKVEYQQYSDDDFKNPTDKYLRTINESGEIEYVKESQI